MNTGFHQRAFGGARIAEGLILLPEIERCVNADDWLVLSLAERESVTEVHS
jgi:hypothetical protein